MATPTSRTRSDAPAHADDEHKGSLLNTVVASLLLSILSILIAAFNLYYTALRPPAISATMTLVAVTTRGGPHITIPTSISNSGARPATVLNAKLIESEAQRQSLWGAAFETTMTDAVAAINGKPANDQATVFAPVLIPPNAEVQTALVFIPSRTPGFYPMLLARSGKRLRYTPSCRPPRATSPSPSR